MQHRVHYSLDELEESGRRYEKQRELNLKFTEPPLPEKLHVRGAGCKSTSSRNKLAAFVDETLDKIVVAPREDEPHSDDDADAVASMQRMRIGARGTSYNHNSYDLSHNQSAAPRSNNSSRSPDKSASPSRTEYIGICYVCQAIGHHSSVCPLRTCYNCKITGHIAKNCTERSRLSTPIESCQACGAQNTTLPKCEKCKNYWASYPGNE